jgi:membrane associated rhomboid family serine protease
MTQFGMQRFNYLPPVIKNLLILNGLMFLATLTFPQLIGKVALYYPLSPLFQPYQIVTHMFTHGSFGHVFFNMFALWMFGAVLENVWGPQRFLTFYIVTGLGAAAIHTGVHAFQLYQITGSVAPEVINGSNAGNFTPEDMQRIRAIFTPTVGASGAVYGVLLAYGMLFPNTLLYIYFLVPIKAKYLVIILTAVELYLAFMNNPNDNIAHFAHLGGMVFGFFMIRYWKRNPNRFY